MCPTRATVIEVELLEGTMLCGGPHIDADGLLGDELLDDEPPPEQAATRVLNKNTVPNNRAWVRK